MKGRLSRLIARMLGRDTGDERAMAAGSPGMPDCESVMKQLWDYLDGELTAERKAVIRAHLELCKRCHPQFEFEQAFLEAIAASAPSHSDPERLRSRLLAALEKEGFMAA